MTAFSHQRVQWSRPMQRGLAVIHQTPPASSGTRTTWALLATRVRVTKSGMPGTVQRSGETRPQITRARKSGWRRKSDGIGPVPARQRSQAWVPM